MGRRAKSPYPSYPGEAKVFFCITEKEGNTKPNNIMPEPAFSMCDGAI
jgi:hypothetical protein